MVDATSLGLYLYCLFHFLGLRLYQQVILAPHLNPSFEWYWRLGKMCVFSEFVSRYLAHPNIHPPTPCHLLLLHDIFSSRLLTLSRSPLSAPHLLLLTKCRTSPPPSPKTWVSFREWDIKLSFSAHLSLSTGLTCGRRHESNEESWVCDATARSYPVTFLYLFISRKMLHAY